MLLALLAALTVVHRVDAQAAASPDVRCHVRALAAASAALGCQAKRTARVQQSGDVPNTIVCAVKLARQLARTETKFGDGCIGGTTIAVDGGVWNVVSGVTSSLAGSDARCRAAALVAGGRLGRCQLRAAQRALQGRSASPDACQTRFARKLKRAARPNAAACEAAADAGGTAAGVTANVDALVAVVTGTVTTTSTSSTTAPTQQPTTTTIPETCGNGAVEVPEECDDGARVAGDGCAAGCTLEDATALCSGVPAVDGSAVRAVRVASGLSRPVGVTAPPLDPGHLFVVEQTGRIRLIEHDVLLETPFLDLHTQVSCCGERGLLGLAFHPDYEENGFFFVNYTNTSGSTVIARYQVDALDSRRANADSGHILLQVPQPYPNHNGGHLAFGPDGYLYAGMGDGGGGGDPDENAQDDASLLGKMLRIDVDVDTRPYWAVPPSNPRYATGSDPLELIWAKGLRNPWHFSFDRGTGDLYIGDVGQNEYEEIDWVPASSTGGENYGWDVFEATSCFEPDPAPSCPSPPTGFTFPVHEYDHALGCSVTGGYVYRGCTLPALHGRYFYGDYCGDWVRSFVLDGGVATSHQDHTSALDPPGAIDVAHITSLGEDARGELYVVDVSDGELFRVEPAL